MEKQLEEYKQVLRRRQLWGACGILVTAFCTFGLNYLLGPSSGVHIPDFIRGFQTGLFTGLELLMVYYVCQMMAAQKNDQKLRKMYISEHDERSASIRLHTFAASGAFSLGLLALAAIVAGFFDEKICLTLIVTLIALIFVKLPFKLYYSKKF